MKTDFEISKEKCSLLFICNVWNTKEKEISWRWVWCKPTRSLLGKAVKTDGWGAAWVHLCAPTAGVKILLCGNWNKSPGLSQGRRCCSWVHQEVPVMCPENESLTIPIITTPLHTHCTLYLMSRPTALLWILSFKARGTMGTVQWASFGVAFKMSSWRQLHLTPANASSLQWPQCVSPCLQDRLLQSISLPIRHPIRQLSVCHPPTLSPSKGSPVPFGQSRTPVRPGSFPLLQLHLSPPVPHSSHSKDSAAHWSCSSGICAQRTFSSWALIPFLERHVHTHTRSSPAHLSGHPAESPLADTAAWVRRASPGPAELTYAMAPAPSYWRPSVTHLLLTECKREEDRTVNDLACHCVAQPQAQCLYVTNPQWRVISRIAPRRPDCLFCHIFHHLFRGPVHKYLLLSLTAPRGWMRRMLKQSINIWRFIECSVYALPCNPHNNLIYLVL